MNDRWPPDYFPTFEGCVVTRLCIHSAFAIQLTPHGNDWGHVSELLIEAPFQYQVDDAIHTIALREDPMVLAPALAIFAQTVRHASFGDDATVVIEFENGAILRVGDDDSGYELWTLVGPDGLLAVGGPGTQVTTFPPALRRPRRPTAEA